MPPASKIPSSPLSGPNDVAELLTLGKQRGFVTLDEVMRVASAEEGEAVERFDEICVRLNDTGIPVRDPLSDLNDPPEVAAVEEQADLSDALLNDNVRLYLREIGQVPLLTTEQEQQIAHTIMDGQQAERQLKTEGDTLDDATRQKLEELSRLADDARQKMAAANLRLVVSIAKRYRDRGLPLLDLIQEGSLGLLRAIEKFNVTKGFKFSTYATWWIKQALSRALADQSRLVRLPVHLGETLNRIQIQQRTLVQTLGREPTDTELAQAVGLTEEKLRELRRTAQDPVSLAMPVGEDGDSTLADFVPGEMPGVDESTAIGMLREQIAAALDQLSERERLVLERRYGLIDGRPRTLEEVGREFKVTRERVRQIEVKALRKLRHPKLGKLLKDYLEQS